MLPRREKRKNRDQVGYLSCSEKKTAEKQAAQNRKFKFERQQKRHQEIRETLQLVRVQSEEKRELMQEALDSHPDQFKFHLD